MKSSISLSDLKLNKKAKVVDINCSGDEKRRFLDLGIVKDTVLVPIFNSPFGNPTAYEIRKTIIAIRKEDANKIKVETI